MKYCTFNVWTQGPIIGVFLVYILPLYKGVTYLFTKNGILLVSF